MATAQNRAVVLVAIMMFVAGAVAGQTMILPDRVVQTNGPPLSGIKITAADVTGITFTKFEGGEARKVEIEKVAEVFWGDTPNEFRQAIADFKAGNFDKALQNFAKAPLEGPRDFWYKPYRLLFEGECLLRLGRAADALPKFETLLAKHARSYYEIQAILDLGDCQMALKAYDKAAEAFARLDPKNVYDTTTATEPYGKVWQLRGREKVAAAYAKTPDKADEAAKIYDKLGQVTEALLADVQVDQKDLAAELTGIQQRSLVGQVEVLVAAQKLDAARERLDAVQGKISDKSARLRMFLTMGDLLAKAAEALNDAKTKSVRLKESALSYMRVYILYPDQKPERLKAMMGAATAFQLLGTPTDKGYAGRLYKEIITEFPGTPEAVEAPRRLEAMGIK